MSRDGFPRNPYKYQGGWITLALAALGAVSSYLSKKKTAKQEDQAQAQAGSIEQQKLDLANKQDARSQQLFDDYTKTYQPLEHQIVGEAEQGLSPAREANAAETDVAGAFAGARASRERDVRRSGANPASGVYDESNRLMALDEARARAGARTRARGQVRDLNFARKIDAASLGRGLPATATSMAGLAGSSLASAGATAQQNLNYARGINYDTSGDFGASLANLASDAYDFYKSRKPPVTSPGSGYGAGGDVGG